MLREKDWHMLDIPEGKINDYEISHDIKPPGTELRTSNMRTTLLGQQPGKILKFGYETCWHKLSYDGGTWMTDLPIEQSQHDRELADFKGHVLVGGLGLGYAVTHLCRRPEINHVTVVEKSIEVVKLVEPYLKVPRGKLTVITEDLFNYLRDMRPMYGGPAYDYCFYDIWQSDGEHTLWEQVVPLRKLTQEGDVCDDLYVICWNEDVMRGQLVFSMRSRLLWLDDRVKGLPKGDKRFQMPTLENMCEKRDDIYWDWMVPFWRSYRDDEFSKEELMDFAGRYCAIVGKPGWEQGWQDLV